MSTVCYISLIICVCAHPLHSCSIEVAVTIEPSEDNSGNASDEEASPKKPLRAVQVVNGYLLRDPHEKNRLSVWFTGGKLAPYSPPDSAESLDDDTKYGDFEEWKAIFDREYKTSWSESFKNMGAVLFLGAELPQGMNPDGSMGYSLTRPYGGHGKSYIDVSCSILPLSIVVCIVAFTMKRSFNRFYMSMKVCSSLEETMVRFMSEFEVICYAQHYQILATAKTLLL
jgi:hypothetical protein